MEVKGAKRRESNRSRKPGRRQTVRGRKTAGQLGEVRTMFLNLWCWNKV